MTAIALGDILEIRKGKKPAVVHDTPLQGSTPCILIDEVRGAAPSSFTSDDKGVEARPDDLCIVWDGANAGTVGFGVSGFLGSTVARLRLKRPDIWDTEFIGRLLQGQFTALNEAAKGKGATIPHVDKRHLEQLLIPCYPLGKQRRIAAILDQTEELRRKRQRAIKRHNQLGPAVFHEMFGNLTRAGTAWAVRPLAELCDLVRGSSPRPQGDPRYFGGSVPRLMIADVTRDGMNVTPRIDSLTEEGAKKSRPMPAGSVVMAVSGAVGLPAILRIDACIHDGFVGFRNLDQSILPEFFYWYLRVNREQNKSQGTGAIWVNLTTNQVKRFNVPVPPINLQERFVMRMKKVATQGDLQVSNLTKIDLLFASLQHRAFQGGL